MIGIISYCTRTGTRTSRSAFPFCIILQLISFVSSKKPPQSPVSIPTGTSNHLPIPIPYVRKSTHDSPDPSLDFDSFGFSLNGIDTDYMWFDRVRVVLKVKENEKDVGDGGGDGDPFEFEFEQFSSDPDTCLQKLQPLQLHPSSTILNYGQGLFEGLKAFRRTNNINTANENGSNNSNDNDGNDDIIVIFRPSENAKRLSDGAKRLLLPEVPRHVFLTAVESVVRANARFIPPHGRGALYLRPLLFGSEKSLGVKPSNEVIFCIYASPVGNYFKKDKDKDDNDDDDDDDDEGDKDSGLKCIKLQAVGGYSRASRGGSGNIKASGNYAPPFLVQREVREREFDEALFLDCIRGEYIEEAGASNFFAVFTKTKTIVTPTLETKTILPGITRSSIIQLIRSELGGEDGDAWKVEERQLSILELKCADEAFCCGTGASITPVGVVSYFSGGSTTGATTDSNVDESGDISSSSSSSPIIINDFEVTFGDGKSPGKITRELYRLLLGIQNGDLDDAEIIDKYSDWIHIVEP